MQFKNLADPLNLLSAAESVARQTFSKSYLQSQPSKSCFLSVPPPFVEEDAVHYGSLLSQHFQANWIRGFAYPPQGKVSQISACLRPKSCKLRERVLTKPVKGIQGAILPCGTTRKLHGDQIATKDQTQLFLSSKTWKQQEKSWDFPNGPMTCTWASSIVGGRSVAFNDVTSCALMQSAAVLKFP